MEFAEGIFVPENDNNRDNQAAVGGGRYTGTIDEYVLREVMISTVKTPYVLHELYWHRIKRTAAPNWWWQQLVGAFLAVTVLLLPKLAAWLNEPSKNSTFSDTVSYFGIFEVLVWVGLLVAVVATFCSASSEFRERRAARKKIQEHFDTQEPDFKVSFWRRMRTKWRKQ